MRESILKLGAHTMNFSSTMSRFSTRWYSTSALTIYLSKKCGPPGLVQSTANHKGWQRIFLSEKEKWVFQDVQTWCYLWILFECNYSKLKLKFRKTSSDDRFTYFFWNPHLQWKCNITPAAQYRSITEIFMCLCANIVSSFGEFAML